ncbi:MAG: endonuclease III [Lachnospiraceae bacterium]|nr:endonuclease III [Lachnospiraceae bacterium]
MRKRTRKILNLLDKQYGTEYFCYLNHENPGQLLIATILSSQCTDVRVNVVTKDLFVKYPDMEAFAKADLEELEQDVRSTGFYKNKAKNIIGCAKAICEKHGGQVPKTLSELINLPGVGRKTANVIRSNIYHDPSIVVDTHVKRISKRLGLTAEINPEKVEYDLMTMLPKDHWILYNIQIITFGRQICFARGPKCEICFLKEYCLEYQKRVG